jgi:hypothetical protein
MLDGSDGFAMDFIFPMGHAVPLDSDKILKWFGELGGVGYIVTIEGNETREVLDLLGVLRVVEVDDGLNFLRIGCAASGHD